MQGFIVCKIEILEKKYAIARPISSDCLSHQL